MTPKLWMAPVRLSRRKRFRVPRGAFFSPRMAPKQIPLQGKQNDACGVNDYATTTTMTTTTTTTKRLAKDLSLNFVVVDMDSNIAGSVLKARPRGFELEGPWKIVRLAVLQRTYIFLKHLDFNMMFYLS